jgi:hypothetical protein
LANAPLAPAENSLVAAEYPSSGGDRSAIAAISAMAWMRAIGTTRQSNPSEKYNFLISEVGDDTDIP